MLRMASDRTIERVVDLILIFINDDHTRPKKRDLSNQLYLFKYDWSISKKMHQSQTKITPSFYSLSPPPDQVADSRCENFYIFAPT